MDAVEICKVAPKESQVSHNPSELSISRFVPLHGIQKVIKSITNIISCHFLLFSSYLTFY